jgi:hypothetical protein
MFVVSHRKGGREVKEGEALMAKSGACQVGDVRVKQERNCRDVYSRGLSVVGGWRR